MYIHEAVRKAEEDNAYITRVSWSYITNKPCEAAIKILPTNTPDCCIIESVTRRNPCCGWRPKAGDLIADDWIVVF